MVYQGSIGSGGYHLFPKLKLGAIPTRPKASYPQRSFKLSTLGVEFGFVSLSPDFLHIATERPIGMEGANVVLELHIANVNGSGDEIYQTGPLYFMDWSPDSAYFLFSDHNGTSYLGQKGASPVEFPLPSRDLRWLDGQTFLFQQGSIELGEIWLGFLNGSSIRIVGPTPINNYDFAK